MRRGLFVGRRRADDRQTRRQQGSVAVLRAPRRAGMEDYYAGRGEARGVWRGAGAEVLGLPAGQTVDGGAFMALARGVSPVDGSVLRVMRGTSTVAAID